MPKATQFHITRRRPARLSCGDALSADDQPQFAAVGALSALAEIPHPDARLIAACDRLALLDEELNSLYRLHHRGYLNRVRLMCPERDALRAEIAAISPATRDGLRVKAETALASLLGGELFALARSALRDFLALDGGLP